MEWEYKIVHLGRGSYFDDPDGPTEAELNELGADGWELATSLVNSGLKFGGRGSATRTLVFKRPVDEERSDSSGGDSPRTGQ